MISLTNKTETTPNWGAYTWIMAGGCSDTTTRALLFVNIKLQTQDSHTIKVTYIKCQGLFSTTWST